jgi:hypothetical protein
MALELTTTRNAAARSTSFLIYGDPGVGKTSLAKTLRVSSDDKLLYVAVDPGQLSLRDRDFHCLPVPGVTEAEAVAGQTSLHAVAAFIAQAQASDNPYDAIVIDGVDDLSQLAILELHKYHGSDGRAAWGDLGDMTFKFFNHISRQPGTIILITHADEVEEEGRVMYRPAFIGGKWRGKLDQPFDEVLAFRYKKKVKDDGTFETTRALQTSMDVDPRYVCKDRSGALDMWEKPDLQAIIDKIRNAKTGSKKKETK